MRFLNHVTALFFAPLCGALVAVAAPSPAHADPEPVVATFAADWSFSFEGELVQGGELEIDYDVSRLPTCRDRRYGGPAWSILAWYRFESGQTGYVPVTDGTGTLYLEGSGELELWFENQGYYGCRAYDSSYGQNYRVSVAEDARFPGWVGNAEHDIQPRGCEYGPCDRGRQPLYQTFYYTRSARERGIVGAIYFDVWKAGVTDFDNPDLWRELDVQLHYRARPDGPFQTEYVDLFERVGNDARYKLDAERLDPFSGTDPIETAADCPDAEILTSGDGVTIGATVEYYFTINGLRLRSSVNPSNFFGRFEAERAPYEICIQQP